MDSLVVLTSAAVAAVVSGAFTFVSQYLERLVAAARTHHEDRLRACHKAFRASYLADEGWNEERRGLAVGSTYI